jgi:hypothetical protein
MASGAKRQVGRTVTDIDELLQKFESMELQNDLMLSGFNVGIEIETGDLYDEVGNLKSKVFKTVQDSSVYGYSEENYNELGPGTEYVLKKIYMKYFIPKKHEKIKKRMNEILIDSHPSVNLKEDEEMREEMSADNGVDLSSEEFLSTTIEKEDEDTGGLHIHLSHDTITKDRYPNFARVFHELWVSRFFKKLQAKYELRTNNRFCRINTDYEADKYEKYRQLNIKNSFNEGETLWHFEFRGMGDIIGDMKKGAAYVDDYIRDLARLFVIAYHYMMANSENPSQRKRLRRRAEELSLKLRF